MEQTQSKVLQKSPLVSIVVITYNSAKYVIETLESTKTQTYQNIELIVSDDCSTDNTVEICRKWIEENKDRFARTELITMPENTGIPSNCNRGLKEAQGEWVKLIAGDDLLLETSLEKNIDHVYKHPEIEVLQSDVLEYKDEIKEEFRLPFRSNNTLRFNDPEITPYEQFQILLRFNPINATSAFVKKEIFEKVGYYDETLKLLEDRPLWLKLTINGVKIYYLDIISAKYRKHRNSVQVVNSNQKLFSDIKLERDAYLTKYYSHLPLLERWLRKINLKRKQSLEKLGFNNLSILSRLVNKGTGHFIKLLIHRVDKRYT
jgi:alpha-1,3-rhamnosyltransferase